MESAVGRVVRGKAQAYELARLVARSSTSIVYEAVGADGARFALKVLHRELSEDERVVARFFREARVAERIHHPAIVKVHEDGVSDGAAFLVLELLSGETLDERRVRRGGRIPVRDVLAVGLEILDVLDAVHAAGIVHRDVKPQNVFVTEGDAVKILDFGTARMIGADDDAPISVDGLVIGTPSFMSPEQARGEREGIDPRSDLWSLAATLFVAITGEYVHPGRDAHQRLLATAMRPARSISATNAQVEARLAGVVDRALAFDRADRWPSARAMGEALREALQDQNQK